MPFSEACSRNSAPQKPYQKIRTETKVYTTPVLGPWVFPRICRSEDLYALALGGVDWARRRSSGQVPYAGKRPRRLYRDDTHWHCGVTCRNLARSSDRMVSRRAVRWLYRVSAPG